MEEFGILSNDYDRFLAGRAELVSTEIQSRIIEQTAGNENQTVNDENYEDEE